MWWSLTHTVLPGTAVNPMVCGGTHGLDMGDPKRLLQAGIFRELCAPLGCHCRVNCPALLRAVARVDPLIFHYPAGPLSRRSYL